VVVVVVVAEAEAAAAAAQVAAAAAAAAVLLARRRHQVVQRRRTHRAAREDPCRACRVTSKTPSWSLSPCVAADPVVARLAASLAGGSMAGWTAAAASTATRINGPRAHGRRRLSASTCRAGRRGRDPCASALDPRPRSRVPTVSHRRAAAVAVAVVVVVVAVVVAVAVASAAQRRLPTDTLAPRRRRHPLLPPLLPPPPQAAPASATPADRCERLWTCLASAAATVSRRRPCPAKCGPRLVTCDGQCRDPPAGLRRRTQTRRSGPVVRIRRLRGPLPTTARGGRSRRALPVAVASPAGSQADSCSDEVPRRRVGSSARPSWPLRRQRAQPRSTRRLTRACSRGGRRRHPRVRRRATAAPA
jgi:hypothetical protein